MQDLLPSANKLGARLKARGETIAIAESSTGGLISAALLSVGGASVYFRGGSVIYTAYARSGLLDIPNPLPPPIERASTEPYALLLADTVRKRLESTWGLGETGATGPTGNRYGDAAGHTCIALVGPNFRRAITVETGSADRVANMRVFSQRALDLLAEALG
jgi:nicotinamide-nucleotide amidase